MSGTSCKDSIALLLEYLDGNLSDEVRARLATHLGDCTPCEEFLRSYRATPGLCKKALVARVPKSVADKLTSFLKEELKKPV